MIKVYDYYQEENKALEERFTLASERIYEIQNEAELCAPYASMSQWLHPFYPKSRTHGIVLPPAAYIICH